MQVDKKSNEGVDLAKLLYCATQADQKIMEGCIWKKSKISYCVMEADKNIMEGCIWQTSKISYCAMQADQGCIALVCEGDIS